MDHCNIPKWKTVPIHDFLVVHGFVHHHISKYLTLFIPDDIINFILVWYYDVSTWTLCEDELDRFFSLKNGEAIYSNAFCVEGVDFCCSLCPNGWKHNQLGFVQYYLEIKSLPANITNCTVYFEFYCYQTKSSWKGIRTLSKISDAVGWFHYTLPLLECKQFIDQQPNRNKSLTFGCCVEILDVNYKPDIDDNTDEQKTNHSDSEMDVVPIANNRNVIKKIIDDYIGVHLMKNRRKMKLNQCTQITWMLNKYPLSRFRDSINPKNFHSPSFNNNYWCFECQANFKHNIMIYCRLKLLRMPYNVRNMKIECLLSTNMKCESDKVEDGNDKKLDQSSVEYVTLNYDHNYSTWKIYETEERHENSLRISCKLKIVEIWDKHNRIVNESEWYKHGITKNYYEPYMIIQYADSIENDGKNQILTSLQYQNKQMGLSKRWIKPNFLNIPTGINANSLITI